MVHSYSLITPQILSLIIQLHIPLATSYANGGPIIKANGAGNGKPTGHRKRGEAEFLLKVQVSFGCPLWWQNTAATQALGKVQASEMKLRWWFPKVSYFYSSFKGQRCLSYDRPVQGKWKMCSTSTLSSTMLHACNVKGIILQKWDLRVRWQSLHSPILEQHNLTVVTSVLAGEWLITWLSVFLCHFHWDRHR